MEKYDHWCTNRFYPRGLCLFGVWAVSFVAACGPMIGLAASQDDVSEPRTMRAAAISFVPQKFDLAGNSDRLERAFRRAAAGGAHLAVAPEGALEGYVVNEIIAGHEKPERMRSVAIPLDSPPIRRFQNLARELDMCLVFGFAEAVGEDVYNCALFIDQQGRICGTYHKMQLAEGYHERWWFNRLGSACRAFNTPLGRCAILICNDRWNPQLAEIARCDGAQLLLIPAFGSRGTQQDEAVLSRGREMQVPVVEANVGVSLIVNKGEIVSVQRREEGIAFAEIDIPPARQRDQAARDETERKFLEWRAVEMQRRYKK